MVVASDSKSAMARQAGPMVMLMGILDCTCIALEELRFEPGGETVASRIPQGETGRESDHLTGDWGGVRSRWVDHGVHLKSAYSGEFFSNIKGGLRESTVWEGLLELGLDLDPEKFSDWKGSWFHFSGLYPHGGSPSGELSGDLSTVSNIDASDAFVLFECWMEQQLWSGLVSFRFGLLAADEEFLGSEGGEHFLNSSFGWMAGLSLNAPTPAYPQAAPGLRVRWDPSDHFYVQAGAYDGNPDPGDTSGQPVNQHGIRINLNSDEGFFSIFETGFLRNHRGNDSSLPGSYKLGGWYHSGEFDHLHWNDSGLTLANTFSSGQRHKLHGNWGIYLAADQWIHRPMRLDLGGLSGISLFTRMAYSPPARNLIMFQGDLGLLCHGGFAGRENDSCGLAFSYLKISPEAQKLARDASGPVPDYECVLELTYQIQLKSWWSLQPDVQFLFHPGGSSEIANAVMLGLRSSFVF